MTDDPNDKSARVVAVIEKAMADLIEIGASHDTAATLLAVQGALRINGAAAMASVKEQVADMEAGEVLDAMILAESFATDAVH